MRSLALTDALIDLGRPGGLLDAADDLSADPLDLVADASPGPHGAGSTDRAAGLAFLAQFVGHDLTTAASPGWRRPQRSGGVPAAGLRRAFDLDSLYGGGPSASPQLYDEEDQARLRIGSGGIHEDLPRDDAARAIVADVRNDANVVTSGLHAALIAFHNRVVDEVVRRNRAGSALPAGEAHRLARRLVVLHYQWVVLHELLPAWVGRRTVDDVSRNRRAFRAPVPVLPVEFLFALWVGHSAIRPSYRVNSTGDRGRPFVGLIADATAAATDDPADLRGGARAPRRFVDWEGFFDFGDGSVQPSRPFTATLASPLLDLPVRPGVDRRRPTSLATRNLLRHVEWSIPSGQAVASALGASMLARADLSDLAGYGVGLERSTPLWLYALREAEIMAAGERFGPVGGRILAEVVVGLLHLDPDSILGGFRRFRPSLPRRTGPTGDFTMVDLLTFAQVDPASRRR